MNLPDVIQGLIASVALFALWRAEQVRRSMLRVTWDDVREHRGRVLPIARRAYAAFQKGKSEDWPKDLRALLGAASLPPNVPVGRKVQIRNWLNDNQSHLNPDQRRMWEFAAAVYPAYDLAGSVIPANERNDFHESRRQLATFFHRQWEATSNRQLYSVVPHTYDDVVLLSWLELALAHVLMDGGPPGDGYGGKLGLFEYGRYLEKRHAR